ncbi:exodeoxyribonuclease V subunit gamma [Nocardioides euryhalodurans]|uniref:RecBCD enzyme subunit RecC n=1 Tax=Nocardioides euryhalodurans TaxID=2518370 RepID=A0A4P7GKW3_9ACTN|nr:exodeoxyribonuclease V subunit gamma [Nocardioides euryhalodurans]QBR92705.1 exodeoxyribonuclease V subunit gamma [Nocardioides euryhalodurans]
MTLFVHRAERTDVLADGLADLLLDPLEDPFAGELVVVPAKGIERWLSQRLSHRLGCGPDEGGVCAGVEFRSPRSLVAELTGTTRDDPWRPDALAWPLLSVLDTCLDEPWAASLAAHLGHGRTGEEADLRRGRRYAVARRVAGLFASYATQRPQVLVDWLAGEPTDGLGRPLPDDLAWQPPLWRALVDEVAAPAPHERHATVLERLRGGATDLPARLSLFGHTRLPTTEIELLDALATHHAVHLWLPHPGDALWQALSDAPGPGPRRDHPGHLRVGHPLLATLGRDVRELQARLAEVDTVDETRPAPDRPDSLLGWLQSDLSANTVAPAGRSLADDDRSVQVHRCHGPARQVDVLREVLLGLLEDDPTLQPRDILVMCPDIETYAPLITAAFGLGEVVPAAHPGHQLRVLLADRALSRTNPLLGVAAQLLDLAGSRVTASQLLDLAQAPVVRSRFGFSDDDLDTMAAWVRQAGIRWGLDQEHREPYGLSGIVHNTWQFGLDRILTGVTMSEDARAWLDVTLPLDDVGSNRVDLAGRVAELVARVREVTDRLTGTRPLGAWVEALATGIASLTHTRRADQGQVGQLHRELSGVLGEAGARATTELRLPDVRALLGDHLAGRPTRANFRSGTLTVCTMVPMRSVPHRVVCLVGVDDGVFPRVGAVDGDDVLARDPVVGERDVRSEDRQLMLDAVLAATERLVVTYTGADEHTGQARPPAVPLGELLDALDRTTPEPIRERVVVRHPLQAFDVRNVAPGRLGVPGPFTFDERLLSAARTAASQRPAPPAFLDERLPPRRPDDVALVDLLGFFADPVKGFFRSLDVTLPWEVDGVADAMPVEIDQLETWGVGDRMLADMLRMVHPDQALGLEWRRGSLPPGQLGWRKAQEVRDQAMALAVAALTHRQTTPRSHDVDVALPDGRRLTGTVGPVYDGRLVEVGFSRLGGKQLLQAWVRLLALAAHDPDKHWTALVVGRAARGTTVAQRLLGPADHAPDLLLRDLVDLYDRGRREPLPLPVKTSYAWASAVHQGDDPVQAAERRWKSSLYPGENELPAHVRVWGRHAPLPAVLGEVRPDEDDLGQPHRLGALSVRLWGPLLRAERSL